MFVADVISLDILKFYTKLAVIKVRALMFWFAPVLANRDGWENRILLINLDLIGDIIMLTAVLKHYRAAMHGKKLFLLLNSASGMSPLLVQECVDEVLTIDANAFKVNPRYGYAMVKKLRHIGFVTVVEHNPAMEFIGKVIAVELGAKEVIGYQVPAIEDNLPSSVNAELGLRYFHRVLSRKFTKMIPATPEPGPKRFTHIILRYAEIFKGVTGQVAQDLAPRLPEHLPSDEMAQDVLKKNSIKPFSYALFSLGTSTPHKEWPVERFAAVAKLLATRNIPIVLTGGKKDVSKSKAFIATIGGHCFDLTGKTTILEVASLIRFSLLTISNDTSIVHFAVAFKRPSLTIQILSRPGWTDRYGYRDINKWILKEDAPCFGDNGRCTHLVGPNDPSPCIAAISVGDAEQELVPLLNHITSNAAYPSADFSLATR